MPILTGNIVDIFKRSIYPASIFFENRKIISITALPADSETSLNYIIPGFTDAHVHIESSMLVPAEFARLAVVHGTVSTISDPHEIANVCGMNGIEFMIENGNTVPFKFNFGAPSCVPATIFETAGAAINTHDIEKLLQRDDIKYLAEMMNFPGVLFKDAEVMKKIAAAHTVNKPVDGHAPGLRAEDAKRYCSEGISTDHECFTAEEALDKLKCGMKILIREGSAAKNFEALIDLLHDYPDMIMFCSDDKHPDSLVAGHINQLCARAVAKGINVFNVLQAACINPVLHYKTDTGLLRPGDDADFIVIKDLKSFDVIRTYIAGELVAQDGKSTLDIKQNERLTSINNFNCQPKWPDDFVIDYRGEKIITVIEAFDSQLVTNKLEWHPNVVNQTIVSDIHTDILKIVVVNRYHAAPIAKAFIKNMGLKNGAIASSVAHDSHNIVAVGVDDVSICKAINLIIEKQGGISCVGNGAERVLGLPVAGLMGNGNGYKIAAAYTAIDAMAKNLGSCLTAPFMTLSFMALLVIPSIKLSDKGLFDSDRFEFIGS